MKKDISAIHEDLNSAIVLLKTVERQARSVVGESEVNLEEDFKTIFQTLFDKIHHLETEISAVSGLLVKQEELRQLMEREILKLNARVITLEEDEITEPIVLQVVKKRTVGKKKSQQP